VVSKTLSWPLRAARIAWQASSIWSAEAQSAGAPSRVAQCCALWSLALRENLSPEVYYLHKLWHKRPGVSATDWMDQWDSHLIYQLFTDAAGIGELDDKSQFGAFCAKHALPHLPVLALVSSSGQVIWQQDEQRLPASDIFVKPAGGSLGLGTRVFVYVEAEKSWREDGMLLGESELLARIAAHTSGLDLVVQQRARNHPELEAVSPDALSTLRCITYRYSNGKAHYFRSALRMGRRRRIVDHAIHGGVLAEVDNDGYLRSPRDRHVEGALECHPDTGERIAGRRLPAFDEMKKLAIRAHEALGTVGIVSWDIGLLADGPVLVEGNSTGHLDFIQLALDQPLGRTEYVQIAARLAAESTTSP